MTWKISLCLASAIITISIGTATADEPSPALPAEDISQAEIKALIEQLGDRDTAQRDAAAKRLIRIGPAAKAQLEAACANDRELDVIRRKAKVLLLSIIRRERADRWNAFVSGKANDGPPGWKKFHQAVGDTPNARKQYVKVYRAEPKLLEIYAEDPAKAALLTEALCMTRKPEDVPAGRAPEIPIDSMIAHLLVAGDRKANQSSQAATGLAIMMGFDKKSMLSEKVFKAGKTSIRFALAMKNDSCKPLLRKLVGRWICNTKFEDEQVAWIISSAAELNIKEALPAALDQLQKISAPIDGHWEETFQAALSILAVAKLGDVSNLKHVEPLLEDSRVLGERGQGNKRVDLQVRDVALVALLCLTDQKMQEYNIKNMNNTFDGIRALMVPCFFTSNTQRQQALSKWQSWRKKHPTMTPELIYIASKNNGSPHETATTGFVSTN